MIWTHKPGAKPFEVTMLLDGYKHNMMIDTGATVPVVSNSTWQQLFGERELEQTAIQLKTYSDEQLKVLSQAKCVIVVRKISCQWWWLLVQVPALLVVIGFTAVS